MEYVLFSVHWSAMFFITRVWPKPSVYPTTTSTYDRRPSASQRVLSRGSTDVVPTWLTSASTWWNLMERGVTTSYVRWWTLEGRVRLISSRNHLVSRGGITCSGKQVFCGQKFIIWIIFLDMAIPLIHNHIRWGHHVKQFDFLRACFFTVYFIDPWWHHFDNLSSVISTSKMCWKIHSWNYSCFSQGPMS